MSSESYQWLNEPQFHDRDRAIVISKPQTDFWQRTHYGFRRDDGHIWGRSVRGNFVVRALLKWHYRDQYDQCGLMCRIDENNWVKLSVEQEETAPNKLGSVVTNDGYSDWATQPIAQDVTSLAYEIRLIDGDLFLGYQPANEAIDPAAFIPIRIAHLHLPFTEAFVGVYGCSPVGNGVRFEFSDLEIQDL